MKKILLVLSLMMIGALSAMAAGTTAGTNIDNTATLQFKVGGDSQTAKDSNTDSFVVDRKIDVVVASANSDLNKTAHPNEEKAYLSFTVTNQGNAAQDFDVSSIATNVSNDDRIDVGTVHVYVDKDGSSGDGVYIVADDSTEDLISNLAPDDTIYVYIVADKIPASAVDGDVDELSLLAGVRELGGAAITDDNRTTADKQNAMDDVFVDGDGDAAAGANDGEKDGKHIAYGRFVIKSAVLSFRKWSIVVSDGINTDDKAKRIPNANLRYCFELNNTGTEKATKVYWTDTINSSLTITKVRYEDTTAAVDTLENCDCPSLNYSAAGDGDDGSTQDTRIPATGSEITLELNSTICGYIDVTVK